MGERGNRARKIITAAGLICLVMIIFMKACPARPDRQPEQDAPPPPEPAVEVTSMSVVPGVPCVVRYYPRTDYPDRNALSETLEQDPEIERDGKTYSLYAVTDGLVSTREGDCWEAAYRLKGG